MKKLVAIIIELIPIAAAVLTYALILLPLGNAPIKQITNVTMIVTLLGFVFGIIGRKIEQEDRAVKILGTLDWVTSGSVFIFYALVFFVMAQ